MSDAILERLAAAVPAESISTDEATLAAHSTDTSGDPTQGRAIALIRPESAQQVSAILAAANATRTPVVPQGRRSGLLGAAQSIEGAILLDLTALDRIVEIDPVDRLAIVEPGVVIADLQRAVADRGLFYAPDPASADRASVGGTIATNAGGMRCIKYGVTRDAVRSLEVVLADGTILRTRPATIKAVAGLDLTSLVVGSEGTLAVVTQATLALHPAPGPSIGVAATFASIGAAIEAAAVIAGHRRRPSTLEFLDGVALRGIRVLQPELGIPADAEGWLVAVTDEWEGADGDLDRFEREFRAYGALSIQRADEPEALARLLSARRALQPALDVIRGGATHGDLSIPPSRLPLLVERAAALAAEHGVEISLAGHVGDGNLHPTVVFDPRDPGELASARAAEAGLLALAAEVGGTIAGEHGIGTAKLGMLDAELPPALRTLQRSIKAAFDPNGILNPGRKL